MSAEPPKKHILSYAEAAKRAPNFTPPVFSLILAREYLDKMKKLNNVFNNSLIMVKILEYLSPIDMYNLSRASSNVYFTIKADYYMEHRLKSVEMAFKTCKGKKPTRTEVAQAAIENNDVKTCEQFINSIPNCYRPHRFKHICEADTDMTEFFSTIMTYATSNNLWPLLKLAIAKVSTCWINRISLIRIPPAAAAIDHGNVAMLKHLLETFITPVWALWPDFIDKTNLTEGYLGNRKVPAIMHYAGSKGQVEVVRFLFKHLNSEKVGGFVSMDVSHEGMQKYAKNGNIAYVKILMEDFDMQPPDNFSM